MSKVLNTVSQTLNEKLVQISLVGGILFYIVASQAVFDFVKHNLNHLLGVLGVEMDLKGTQQTLFHAVVFAILLYFSAKYLLGPVVNLLKK
tara:strand:- start:684 stop:956 length:273 start_codon:yes stop_codon:yes gene_type:complete